MPRPSLAWIGAARVLFALFVVFVHANQLASSRMSTWWPTGISTGSVVGLCVPGFLFLAGWAFAQLPPVERAAIRWRDVLRREARTLVLPLLTWSVVSSLVEDATGLSATRASLAEKLFLGYGHLYFLVALLQLHLIGHAFARAFRARAPAAGLAFGIATALVFYGASSLTLWTHASTDELFEQHLIRTFAPWAIFFFGGAFLATRPRLFDRLCRPLGLAALAAGAAAAYALHHYEIARIEAFFGAPPRTQLGGAGLPWQVAAALFIVCALRALAATRAARALRIVARLGAHSLTVYLAHVAILLLLASSAALAGLPVEPRAFALVLFPATTAFAFAFAWLAARAPLGAAGRALLGVRRARRAGGG